MPDQKSFRVGACKCILLSTIYNNCQIAMENLKSAYDLAASKGHALPIKSLCRMLPKGDIGLQQVKELHDNGNAAVIPGIWTSV
jgi:hypothetical protein